MSLYGRPLSFILLLHPKTELRIGQDIFSTKTKVANMFYIQTYTKSVPPAMRKWFIYSHTFFLCDDNTRIALKVLPNTY